MKRKNLLNSVPTLPDQEKFLLDLQSNNYSMQTILSYARDLAIFSVYLHFNKIEFKKVSKEDISNYKGYLRSGNHLKDLDKVRRECMKSGLDTTDIDSEALGGSARALKETGGMNTPVDESENINEHSRESKEAYMDDFLTHVYSKVYGSLGILDRPLNSRARSENGLDVRSINRMLSALRSYLKFRISWDLEIPLPPDAISMVKSEKKMKKVASFEDLVRLIESPMEFEKDEKVALRNRCMLEMLFATGMRISELISLDLEQLNVEGKMYITGKGRKERRIFVTPRALGWVNKYLKLRLEYAFSDRVKEEQPGIVDSLYNDLGIERKEENMKPRETNEDDISKGLNLEVFDSENRKYISLVENYRKNDFLKKFDSPALFIPLSGSRSRKANARISTNYFQEKIADYRRRLGIQIPTSAHSLRHGYATYLAQQGASPAALQVLLGHESLDTTTKYVHASEKFAEDTVKKNHPLQ
ncbi:MAG: tyrosine-type recombinase/integrase [Candidatus Dojkabacteria bacterium]|jgi:site-specific recombinase XerD|nr:tyrosine-type recombinase/integrase [Candidatus Dojkabacteria bacterium]